MVCRGRHDDYRPGLYTTTPGAHTGCTSTRAGRSCGAHRARRARRAALEDGPVDRGREYLAGLAGIPYEERKSLTPSGRRSRRLPRSWCKEHHSPLPGRDPCRGVGRAVGPVVRRDEAPSRFGLYHDEPIDIEAGAAADARQQACEVQGALRLPEPLLPRDPPQSPGPRPAVQTESSTSRTRSSSSIRPGSGPTSARRSSRPRAAGGRAEETSEPVPSSACALCE